MKFIKALLAAAISVISVLALQPAAQAIPLEGTARDGSRGSDARYLQEGETVSGRFAVASAGTCKWVYYHLTQVEPTKVKMRYGFGDDCRGYTKIAWAVRSERYKGDGAGGARKDHTFECYTCHKIWRNVYMHDPKGIQRFEMATMWLGLNGSTATSSILNGEIFYT
jgi:hypothetical protein